MQHNVLKLDVSVLINSGLSLFYWNGQEFVKYFNIKTFEFKDFKWSRF